MTLCQIRRYCLPFLFLKHSRIPQLQAHNCCRTMENPREEIKDIIRGLVCRPTLEQQKEILRRYFTPDVEFTHFTINNKGIDDLIGTYGMAELTVNYQDVIFYQVTYDEKQDALGVHMSVGTRFLPRGFRPDRLHFHALLELVDRKDEDGRVKKFIKTQRDYFLRDPMIQAMPIIGPAYNSEEFRFLVGRLWANTYRALRFSFTTFVPSRIQKLLYNLWLRGPHGMPGTIGTGAFGTETVFGNIGKQVDALVYANGVVCANGVK